MRKYPPDLENKTKKGAAINMKKHLMARGLTGFLLLALMAGCGGAAAPPVDSQAADSQARDRAEGKRIAICLPFRDQAVTIVEDAATAALQEMGYTVDAFDANSDVNAQISQVAGCSINGYEGMIVMCSNTASTQALIDAAKDVPVVFSFRGADYDALKAAGLYYVGCDYSDQGALQADWLTEYCKNQGKDTLNVVMFMGTLGDEPTTKRTDSFKEAMEANGVAVNYVFEDTADWDRSKAMDKFSQFYNTGTAFDAVVANNDEMALGVVEAYSSSGNAVDVPVLGVDGTDMAIRAIQEGTLAFTASQNCEFLGSEAARAIDEMINTGSVTGADTLNRVNTAPLGIDASNADEQ